MDLPIPATTDGQRLADSLNANNATEGLQVVFATYQSIEVIHRAQEIAGDEWRDFNLIICDEAHRTTGATLTGEDERVHEDPQRRVHPPREDPLHDGDAAYFRGEREE